MSDAAPEHIPYRITAQKKDKAFEPDGTFQDVWTVSFEAVDTGTHSFVTIPVREYTPANVDVAIEAELENVVGVHGLGPQPHPDNAAE